MPLVPRQRLRRLRRVLSLSYQANISQARKICTVLKSIVPKSFPSNFVQTVAAGVLTLIFKYEKHLCDVPAKPIDRQRATDSAMAFSLRLQARGDFGEPMTENIAKQIQPESRDCCDFGTAHVHLPPTRLSDHRSYQASR